MKKFDKKILEQSLKQEEQIKNLAKEKTRMIDEMVRQQKINKYIDKIDEMTQVLSYQQLKNLAFEFTLFGYELTEQEIAECQVRFREQFELTFNRIDYVVMIGNMLIQLDQPALVEAFPTMIEMMAAKSKEQEDYLAGKLSRWNLRNGNE